MSGTVSSCVGKPTHRCPAPGWVVFATKEGQKKAAATMNEEGQREHGTYCAPVYGRRLMIRYETLNHCMEWCILFLGETQGTMWDATFINVRTHHDQI